MSLRRAPNRRRIEEELEFHTPVPGQDFEHINGDGGLGNYTFHQPRDESIPSILKRGGADADQLIDEWFHYEYKNRRAKVEYDRVMRYANAKAEEWDEKWKKEHQVRLRAS